MRLTIAASCRGLVSALLIALPMCAAAEQVIGRVVGVTDGDTLKLLTSEHNQLVIRIGGIDAPERGQPFGAVAKKRLSELAYQREAVAECRKSDRYGRLICTVLVDQKDVGLKMVNDGLAWHFKRYAREQPVVEAEIYAGAEAEARRHRKGLWRDREPIAPWDWRTGLRQGVRLVPQ